MPESPLPLVPTAPFVDWPNGLVFGEGDGLLWFLPPATLCIQTHVSRLDVRAARDYLAAIRAIRDRERDAIAHAGGLRFYQDFRSLSVVEREARIYLAEQARADFGRWNIAFNKIELPLRNPIVCGTIRVIAKLIAKMGLPPFEFPLDLAAELARDGLTPPEPVLIR